MGRIVALVLITLGLIALDWYRRRDNRKTLLAGATLVLLASYLIAGTVLRAILPLYLAHLVLVAVAWIGLLYYLLRGRYVWWIFLLPAATLALLVVLNFLEGSRYER